MLRKHVFKIKIILMGDSNSGKSTFIRRLNKQDGRYVYQPTMGVDFHIHKVVDKEDPNTEYYFYFYDGSGLKKFQNILYSYYRYCPLAIIFNRSHKYTDESTMYETLKEWMDHYTNIRPDGQMVILENNDNDITDISFDKNKFDAFKYNYRSMIPKCNILSDSSIRKITDTLITIIKENILKNEWVINVTEGVTKIDEIRTVDSINNRPIDVVKISRCSIM